MPLEPTETIATTEGGKSAGSAFEAALLVPTTETALPVETAPTNTPAAPVAEATPAAPAAPLDAVVPPEGDFKLPTDDIQKPEAPPVKEVKNPAGYRIQELNKEIKEKWTPKVTELEQTISQKEARILELQGLAARSTELETKLKDMEAEVSVVRLERTEAFKNEVEKPQKECDAKIKEFATTYGLDHRELINAVVEQDPGKRKAAIKALTSGLEIDADDADDLRDTIKKAHAIFARQDELYANADKALAELEARKEQEMEAAAASRAEERVKATDSVATRVAKSLPYLADIVNEAAGSVKETDPDKLDVHNKAFNQIAGVALPKLAEKYAKVMAERDELLDEIASYRKASGRVGDGLGAAGLGEGKPKSLLEGLLAGVAG